MEKTEEREIRGAKYWGSFTSWVLKWGRWWDWITGAVWLFLIYFFGTWAQVSFGFEQEAGVGWNAVGITFVIIVVGVAVRWLIYQFIQKRRMKKV